MHSHCGISRRYRTHDPPVRSPLRSGVVGSPYPSGWWMIVASPVESAHASGGTGSGMSTIGTSAARPWRSHQAATTRGRRRSDAGSTIGRTRRRVEGVPIATVTASGGDHRHCAGVLGRWVERDRGVDRSPGGAATGPSGPAKAATSPVGRRHSASATTTRRRRRPLRHGRPPTDAHRPRYRCGVDPPAPSRRVRSAGRPGAARSTRQARS